jgi:hypothetical protein
LRIKTLANQKKLAFNSSLNRLEATYAFDDDGKVPKGHHFLAILVPVNKSEVTTSTTLQWKIGTNTEKSAPEEVHFS